MGGLGTRRGGSDWTTKLLVALVGSGLLLVPGAQVATANPGTTERVNVASDGTQGNDGSNDPAISGDGRYVAFYSEASNLVPGDTNDAWDVLVHHPGGGPHPPPVAPVSPPPQVGPPKNGAGGHPREPTDPDGTIVSYDWDFGDGSPHGSGVTTSHTYMSPATKTVTLTVADDGGATDQETLPVTVTGATAPVTSVLGSGTMPGAAGGDATVSFDVARFWIFPVYLGRVQVSDPGAGVSLDTPVFFAPVGRQGVNGATSTSWWFSWATWP